MPRYVVVSGLPASGKTTLAGALAGHLGAPHLDKDDFLERLFAPAEPPSLERRATLSREADALFLVAAGAEEFAVLSSWWQHPLSSSESGTPVEWLRRQGTASLEVHCRCPAQVAVERFMTRQRHRGHADLLRDNSDLRRQFERYASLGPLFPADALVCDTRAPLSDSEHEGLAARLLARFLRPTR